MPRVGIVAACDHIFIDRVAACGGEACGGVGDFDDLGGCAVDLGGGGFGKFNELGVGEDDRCAAVLEYIGDGIHIEAGVDGVEYRTAGGHAKMGLGLSGDVGEQRGDHIA